MALIPMGTPAPVARLPQLADQTPWTCDMLVPIKTVPRPLTVDDLTLAAADCYRQGAYVVLLDQHTVPPQTVNTLYGSGQVSP